MESHISMNPSSARSIRMLLQIGGALIENSDPISMSEGSFERLMNEIDGGQQDEEIAKSNVSNDNDKLPLPLRNFISEATFSKTGAESALACLSKPSILEMSLVMPNFIE